MTLQEIIDLAKSQNKQDIRKFMHDMRKAGIKIQYYRGRYYWHGPAVATSDIQAVMRSTSVRLQWDNLGLDWIVYPMQSLEGSWRNHR